MFDQAQEWVVVSVEWLRLGVETVGAIIIAVGLLVAVGNLLRHWSGLSSEGFTPVRLSFARYLALALEFQLAADILSTAVSPSWDQIGKLAAVAVIRTGLNFFLMWEIRRERADGEPRS
jgi:uncharacterized membrane protein